MPEAISYLAGRSLNDFSLPPELEFVVERGSGPFLYSTTGMRYIDYLLGSGPIVLGHGHARISAAVAKQLQLGTTFYSPNVPILELAELIHEAVGAAESIRFVSDGSEATFYAMRLARAYTGRTKIVKFEGAFHGHHDYAQQSFSPAEAGHLVLPRPDSAGIPDAVSDTVRIARFNDVETVREILVSEGDSVAAVIVEPVQRAIEPLPGFLAALRTLCDEFGVLLIFDEVVTGFRLARGGAQEAFGVTPDLCALGKVMGGGFPIAAVAGRTEIMSLVGGSQSPSRRTYVSGTLNGNPIAAAAGVAAIQVMDEENGPERLAAAGLRLKRGLLDLGEELGVPLTVIGPPAFQELLFGRGDVHNFEDYRALDSDAARDFGLRMISRGVYMRPSSKIYVSLAHGDDVIDETLETAAQVLKEMRDEGVFQKTLSGVS